MEIKKSCEKKLITSAGTPNCNICKVSYVCLIIRIIQNQNELKTHIMVVLSGLSNLFCEDFDLGYLIAN